MLPSPLHLGTGGRDKFCTHVHYSTGRRERFSTPEHITSRRGSEWEVCRGTRTPQLWPFCVR